MDSNHLIANTFNVRVQASWYAGYSDVSQLVELLAWHHKECPALPILNVGEGSNLLFTEPVYQGFVLRPSAKADVHLEEDGCVSVWSGMKMDDFISWSISHGYYGLENLSWIPGTVGASAVQNIGAYGQEVCRHIARVECINTATLEKRVFQNEECGYAYRDSVFKKQRQWTVTRVHFCLNQCFTANVSYGGLAQYLAGQTLTASAVRDAVIALRKTKLPDPKVEGNAGSFFMNPVVSNNQFAALTIRYGDMPHYPTADGRVKLSAAWLIEQAGWKGKTMGRAGVSEKHALILVNRGDATGAEIVSLCKCVQQSVSQMFGVALHPEVNFLP